MKRKYFTGILLFFSLSAFFYPSELLHHNPWELIIYRPENTEALNTVRCFIKLEDENGNEVTYTKAKATYEWTSIPDVVNQYKKKYYLMGGMAAHLNLKPGKYFITVYTPVSDLNDFVYSLPEGQKRPEEWKSNTFAYSTDNPTKVIFVNPTCNENGFYNGSWHIDYKAPDFYKFTKPEPAY